MSRGHRRRVCAGQLIADGCVDAEQWSHPSCAPYSPIHQHHRSRAQHCAAPRAVAPSPREGREMSLRERRKRERRNDDPTSHDLI